MDRKKTLTVEIDFLTTTSTKKGMQLIVDGRTVNGNVHKLKLDLDLSMMPTLADKMWGIVVEKKRELERVENALRGSD